MLSKITILIPSLNRQSFIRRSVEYYKNFNFNIIYLDGSSLSIKENLNKYEKIKYLHLPHLGYIERLLHGIKLIDTEYSILGCDDEFYSINGLNLASEFLDNNTSFASCRGQCISFWKKFNIILSEMKYTNSSSNSEFLNSYSRVLNGMKNYSPQYIYSVSRTNFFKNAISNLNELNLPFFGISELIFEITMIAYGPIKITEDLFWYRSYENSPQYNSEKHLNPKKNIVMWWKEEKYQSSKKEFIFKFANKLSKIDNEISSEKLFDIFNLFIEGSNFMNSGTIKQQYQKKYTTNLIQKVKNYFKAIKLISFNDFTKFENNLKNQKITYQKSEIKKVLSIIKNFRIYKS